MKKTYFQQNVLFLRMRKMRPQNIVANEIGVSRSTVNRYENEKDQNPKLLVLVALSNYFRIPIDMLIKTDMSKLRESRIVELESTYIQPLYA